MFPRYLAAEVLLTWMLCGSHPLEMKYESFRERESQESFWDKNMLPFFYVEDPQKSQFHGMPQCNQICQMRHGETRNVIEIAL